MVKVKEDMTGWKMWEYGVPDSRLTVIKQVEDYIQPSGKHRAMWLCQCNCKEHKFITARGDEIKSGHVKSCGCLNLELIIERAKRRKKTNKFSLSGNYGVLWTTNTNKEVYFDLEDSDEILSHTWREDRHGYIETSINGKRTTMHQLLGYKWHDHKNRNKADNRRENLRPCSHKENNRNKNKKDLNTSGFIGVRWDKNRNKWAASIKVDYKTIYIGRFDNKYDALVARLQAEAKYFKEFAPQRHLFEEYGISTEGGVCN